MTTILTTLKSHEKLKELFLIINDNQILDALNESIKLLKIPSIIHETDCDTFINSVLKDPENNTPEKLKFRHTLSTISMPSLFLTENPTVESYRSCTTKPVI